MGRGKAAAAAVGGGRILTSGFFDSMSNKMYDFGTVFQC